MTVDPGVAVPLLGWLASGLAAVSLTPRNRTAQALLAAGVLLVGTWLCEAAAGGVRGDTATGALLRVLTDVLFLAALAAVVTVLATYPGGRFDLRWTRTLAFVMAALALVAPLAQLVGADELRLGGDAASTAPNPFAQAVLAPLGAVGDAVVATEPGWLVLGVAVLVVRFRRSTAARRRELLRPLLGVGLLAALLVVVAVSAVTGVALAVSEPLFLLALAIFPMVLLSGISRRARQLSADLARSRARLAEAEDRTRRAIERDLHDGVQQHLMAVLSLTELADRHVQRDPALARGTIGELRAQVLDTVAHLREVVSGIRPAVLGDSGVAAALESRLARLADEVEIDTREARGLRWPPGIEAAAYFVACEGVTNALKHAPGSRVRLSVRGTEEHLVVEVHDDGPGIDAGPRSDRSPGTGLAGARDRVESWGGTLEVLDTRPGTMLRASLPVREEG